MKPKIKEIYQFIHLGWSSLSKEEAEEYKKVIDMIASRKDSVLCFAPSKRGGLEEEVLAYARKKIPRDRFVETKSVKEPDVHVHEAKKLGTLAEKKFKKNLSNEAMIIPMGSYLTQCVVTYPKYLSHSLGIKDVRPYIRLSKQLFWRDKLPLKPVRGGKYQENSTIQLLKENLAKEGLGNKLKVLPPIQKRIKNLRGKRK